LQAFQFSVDVDRALPAGYLSIAMRLRQQHCSNEIYLGSSASMVVIDRLRRPRYYRNAVKRD
jgi:hypothetical protein